MPEYASNTQYSEYSKVLNIAGFLICQDAEYGSALNI